MDYSSPSSAFSSAAYDAYYFQRCCNWVKSHLCAGLRQQHLARLEIAVNVTFATRSTNTLNSSSSSAGAADYCRNTWACAASHRQFAAELLQTYLS